MEDIKSLVRDVPDFPKEGILFKDITPVLADPAALAAVIEALAAPYREAGVTQVAGIEARGFIFGPAVAQALGCGFVPVRKPGKLPAATRSVSYDLEYGTDTLELHEDAVGAKDKVLIVDDLLATGGTAAAAVQLIEAGGAAVIGCAFVIELSFLSGRARLGDRQVSALIDY